MSLPRPAPHLNMGEKIHSLRENLSLNSLMLEQLGHKISSLAPKIILKSTLLCKLDKWMNQLAALRRKELETIDKITAIENRHLAMRKMKALPHAKPMEPSLEPLPPSADHKNKKKRGFFWYLFLFMLMDSTEKPKVSHDLSHG